MVLTGANGAGKTNMIEAISLLAPGRGLRRATMDELAFTEGDGAWAVSAEIEGMQGLSTLGTGIDPPTGEDTTNARSAASTARAWVGHRLRRTPARGVADAGDGPFVQRPGLGAAALPRPPGAGGRCEHSSRVSALERSLRSRNRLLEVAHATHWLDAIEHETAEVAVAVAAARAETVRPVGVLARARPAPAFPSRKSRSTAGWNSMLRAGARGRGSLPRDLLDNRARDAAAGRTLDGPHLTDFVVTRRKDVPAARCLDRRAEGAADRPGAGACRG